VYYYSLVNFVFVGTRRAISIAPIPGSCQLMSRCEVYLSSLFKKMSHAGNADSIRVD
jgi:hypothetical protein